MEGEGEGMDRGERRFDCCCFYDSLRLEVGNVVLYLLCNVLGVVTGRIFEVNMRSKYFLSKVFTSSI